MKAWGVEGVEKRGVKKIRPVVITWDDAARPAGWADPEASGLAQCISIGWLLLQNRKVVKIAQTVNNHDTDCGAILSIPRGCIRTIKRV